MKVTAIATLLIRLPSFKLEIGISLRFTQVVQQLGEQKAFLPSFSSGSSHSVKQIFGVYSLLRDFQPIVHFLVN
jgi:hypothetical protein